MDVRVYSETSEGYDKGYDLSSRASPRSNTTYVSSLIWDCVYHDVEFSKTPSHSRRPIQTYLSTSLFVVSAKQRDRHLFSLLRFVIRTLRSI